MRTYELRRWFGGLAAAAFGVGALFGVPAALSATVQPELSVAAAEASATDEEAKDTRWE